MSNSSDPASLSLFRAGAEPVPPAPPPPPSSEAASMAGAPAGEPVYSWALTLRTSGETIRLDTNTDDPVKAVREEKSLLGTKFVVFDDGTLVRADELAVLRPLDPEEVAALEAAAAAEAEPATTGDIREAADEIMDVLRSHSSNPEKYATPPPTHSVGGNGNGGGAPRAPGVQ